MKILSIGNSFSQDAQKYLHRLAKHNGVKMKTVNLYIGGCTMRTHYINNLDNNAAYSFEFNGETTGLRVSIREALASDNWDVVTLQQASHQSTKFETYEPYLSALAELVRTYCPHAKILMHGTWAYEEGSERLANLGYESPRDMLSDALSAYRRAAETISADGIIPSGEAMLAAIDAGIGKIHRDTFHASLGAGRYLIALTWYRTLTGNSIDGDSFNELDEPISAEERRIVISAVKSVTE